MHRYDIGLRRPTCRHHLLNAIHHLSTVVAAGEWVSEWDTGGMGESTTDHHIGKGLRIQLHDLTGSWCWLDDHKIEDSFANKVTCQDCADCGEQVFQGAQLPQLVTQGKHFIWGSNVFSSTAASCCTYNTSGTSQFQWHLILICNDITILMYL